MQIEITLVEIRTRRTIAGVPEIAVSTHERISRVDADRVIVAGVNTEVTSHEGLGSRRSTFVHFHVRTLDAIACVSNVARGALVRTSRVDARRLLVTQLRPRHFADKRKRIVFAIVSVTLVLITIELNAPKVIKPVGCARAVG
jgi:hypothetical protein